MSQLTEEEKVTLNSYNKNAKKWSDAHLSPGYWKDSMDIFEKLLPSGKLLEVGCGGGRDARELIAIGYDYFGTDISQNLLKEARKNNPGAKFVQSSLYDLNFDKKFDGFWCAAVLLHIPKNRIDKALQSIKRNIKSEGVGFIAVKEGKGEKIETGFDKEGGSRLFVYWESNAFKDVLTKNGYQIVRTSYIRVSQRTKWLTYFVRT